MLECIKNLIKRITSVGATFDSGVIQCVKAKYMGKSCQTQVLHDYGFTSSPPSGSIGICLNPRAEESDKASFFFHPKYNVNDLKSGETVIGNFVVGASLYFNADGQGVLTLPDDLIISCNNLTATVAGNAELSVTGDTTLTAANLTATMTGTAAFAASAFTFSGPATFSSGIAVVGAMTINGVSMDENHTHLPGSYVAGSDDVTGISGIVNG